MYVLQSTRQQIAIVANRWKRQYYRNGEWGHTTNGNSADVYERLAALDTATATATDVAAIIGNESWTGHFCGECADYKAVAVEFCETGDGTTICADCLAEALALIEAGKSSPAVDPHVDANTGKLTTCD
jgi:hypothetical protein